MSRIALITGATSGIGKATAESFAEAGIDLILCGRRQEKLDEISAKLSSKVKTTTLSFDVRDKGAVAGMIGSLSDDWKEIDILVNNAGVYEWGSLESVTEEKFHRQFNINVLGLLLASQTAVSYFADNGGSIINIGSGVSTSQPAGSVIYTATKSAVDSITRVLSKELGPKNIRVNSINPGIVDTEGSRAGGFIGSDMEKMFVSMTPLLRVGTPNDIALIASFLASEESHWLTGEIVSASGGLR